MGKQGAAFFKRRPEGWASWKAPLLVFVKRPLLADRAIDYFINWARAWTIETIGQAETPTMTAKKRTSAT